MKTTEEILSERQKTHGDFSTHAAITQDLKWVIVKAEARSKLNNVQMEGLEMILHKIGRILNGNAEHQDHWDDIAGYATLVSKDIFKRDQISIGAPQ